MKYLLALLLCVTLPFGCSRQGPPPQPPKPALTGKLVIGLIPEQNIFRQMERYQPLADYLSERIGTRIALKVLPRYGNIIDNFKSEGMDGAFFGSFTYALAHARIGVNVVARPVGPDNTSTYHGLIFARRRSGIRGAPDLKGKRFAFVDRATTAGYLFPLGYFRENGIEDYRRHLKEFYFTGTHEDAINDVLDGKADAGAAKNTVFERLSAADPRIGRELFILARSPDVPENGLALRKDIPPAIRERLARVLLTMHDDGEGKKVLAEFGALRFIPTTEDDYLPVLRYAERIRLDLAAYEYRNR